MAGFGGQKSGVGSIMGPQHNEAARMMTVRAGAAAVALVALLSFVCSPLLFMFPFMVPVYVAAEAIFAVLYWYRYLLLSYQPIKHRPLSHDPIATLQRTLQHLQQDSADIRQFLSIWFHGAPISAIKRDNVKDLIAYAFWYKTPAEVAAEGRADELEAQVVMIESIWGLQLEAGCNPRLSIMQHMWEPMKHWYRPLAFYLAMEVSALVCRVALTAAGFNRHTWMGLSYYTANMPEHHPAHTATDLACGGGSSKLGTGHAPLQGSGQDVPLVFVHGIGMGLIPYISCLFNMAATGRSVLALELPHISQRWVLWLPTVDEVTEVLVSILNRNSISSCCLIGHSYGTAVASRLLQQSPERIRQLCLIDPICFAMFMPNLLRNFLYESPRSRSLLGDFMMMSAARDLHVSATLSRRFFWSDVNLWEEQLPAGSLVVLSGRDALMAAPQVHSWLEQHTEAVVMYHPDLVHAGFVLDITWQQQILQQLLLLLDRQDESCSYTATAAPPHHDPHQPPTATQCTGRCADRQGFHSQAGDTSGARFTFFRPSQYINSQQVPQPLAPATRGEAPASTWSSQWSAHSAPLHAGSSSCSSNGSPDSYVSCTDEAEGVIDCFIQAQQPVPATELRNGIDQQRLLAALASSQHKALSLSSSFSCDRPTASGAVLSTAASSNKPGLNSAFGSSSQLASQLSSRSREGSLELAPSLGLRSWSGVLPSAASPFTDASTTSVTDAGLPDSPRSVNTFVSASSVQSRRSLAAAAAAQEASQAAHMLLQPLLAMQQQHRQHLQQQQHDERDACSLGGQQQLICRRTCSQVGSSNRTDPSGSMTGGAGVDCLVSYTAVHNITAHSASPAAPTAAKSGEVELPPDAGHMEVVLDATRAAVGVTHRPTHRSQRRMWGLAARQGSSAAAGRQEGVLKKFEGLLRGQRAPSTATKKGDGSPSSSSASSSSASSNSRRE